MEVNMYIIIVEGSIRYEGKHISYKQQVIHNDKSCAPTTSGITTGCKFLYQKRVLHPFLVRIHVW